MAFLILAHNDPEMLHELITALDFPKFDIYVHVDAKTKIGQYNFEKYKLLYSKLYILSNRKKVHWGGYSIVQATLEMYKQAFKNGGYLRYVTLSGNDYPLKKNSEIYRQLCKKNIEYIAGNKVESPYKTNYYWLMDKGKLGQLFSKMIKVLGVKRKKKLVVEGILYSIYFAPQWHALSNECIAYILNLIRLNPQIEKYFRYTYAPDELLVPTLIFNSGFKGKCLCSDFPKGTHYNKKPALHFINYEPVVQIFDESNYEMLVTSDKLFARKLKSEQSKKLIEKIKIFREG